MAGTIDKKTVGEKFKRKVEKWMEKNGGGIIDYKIEKK